MPSQNTKSSPLTDLAYYQEALQHLHEERITDALNSINMAVSLATDKSLYVFYKIQILYLAKLTSECTSLILSHLHFLYTHCTLSQFTEILTDYQEICNCTTEDLADTLTLHHVPAILASVYPELVDVNDYNFHSKALEYEQSGNLEGCISCCHLALKFEPASISLLHLQATCYMTLKDYTQAILIYNQLLAVHTLTSEIAYPLGLAYMQIGNLKQAVSYFKQLLLETPRHIDGLVNLSECYIQLTDYKPAIPYLEKLTRLEPTNTTYLLRLGEIYNLLNRKHLAKKYYKLAHDLQQEKSEVAPSFIKYSNIKHQIGLGLGVLLLLLSISQFYLFNLGVLPSIIYQVDVAVNTSVIPVNGFTDFKVSYKQFPFYAKDPTFQIISTDSKIADVIEGLSSLNGFAIGKATFNVNLNDVTKTSFIIEVRESVPTAINVQPFELPLIVGTTSKLTSTIVYEDDLAGNLVTTFTSTNPTILSVSSSGDMLKALAPGKATIIATCGQISSSIEIEVITP
ncbi:MAG: Ig-like domain-containing protein [Niameybacter sp.]